MKSIYKYSLLLLMALTAGALWSSCSKDDGGQPSISYVRVTNPSSSDSLLTGASLGQMIAIMGNNLGSTSQVWFNDQKAQLISTYVTNGTVLVRVPSVLPNSITNKLKLVFANGNDLEYNFMVDINKPSVSYVSCEYVNAGDSLTIVGTYFYGDTTSIKVMFSDGTATGGVQAKLLSVSTDASTIVLLVPSGAQPGPVTVKTIYGKGVSTLWFRDNRNIINSFSAPTDSTGLGHPSGSDWTHTYFAASDPVIPNINGDFFRVNYGTTQYPGGYSWTEVMYGAASAQAMAEMKNIPQGAFTNPGDYNLKFELNTLAATTGMDLFIYMGNSAYSSGDVNRQSYDAVSYFNLNTHGKWATITIPWVNVFNANTYVAHGAYNTLDSYFNTYDPTNGYGFSMVVNSPNKFYMNFAMDNLRVVPNN